MNSFAANMSMPGLHIRHITENDVPAMVAIEREVFTDAWPEKLFWDEVANAFSFVVEHQKQVIGYVFGYKILDEFEITNVAIKKEWQSRGVGSFMFRFLLSVWQQNRVRNVFLEVRKSNLQARNFYRKWQFVKIGIRKNYYLHPQEDAILMRLDVTKFNNKALERRSENALEQQGF